MSLKKNEELSEKDCLVYENYVHAEVCAQIERELNASKAEVARLQKELDATCNAEELRQERETRKRAEAEVESLREKLDTAIEIAKDALWYARIYENEIHFNKMDGLYQKLVALKNK
jgi:predicted nucleic acid-binding protein